MRTLLATISYMALAITLVNCSNPPQVIQGTVVSFDATSKILVINSESPSSQEFAFSLDGADFGGDPAAGEKVRLSYREVGAKLVAIRLMNLSQQEELKKKGH